jgi:7-carboxy-7-deazaguanine synthase
MRQAVRDPLAVMPSSRLRVNEIFWSLQGESTRVGLPTAFVRLSGCPLRCVWCDTAYAFSEGRSMTVAAILDDVARFKPRFVCVTGGEPLAQKYAGKLLTALCDTGYSVSLETSGALPIDTLDPRVSRVVDVKCPGSGEMEKNLWSNLSRVGPGDELKFVLNDRADYEWARDLVMEHRLEERCPVLFSPVHGILPELHLAEWILADRLPVRFQLQLHKKLWGGAPGK